VGNLRYQLAIEDPESDAILRFVFESLGIRAERAAPAAVDDGPRVVYGTGLAAGPRTITIPDQPGDVIWPDLLEGRSVLGIADGCVPFDLVRGIGAFLRDEVNDGLGPDGLDLHGRLNYSASFPARSGEGGRPIVNAYVNFLGQLIQDHLGVTGQPRWPGGRRAAIGLSHDVDTPDRYAFLESSVRPWRLRRAPRTYLLTTWRLTRERVRDRRPDRYWLFDQVAESEARAGFSSTFFFATVPFHRRDGAAQDVAYDVRRPKVRRAIGTLRGRGFEIGLHASYRAHESAARLRRERDELGEIAGVEIAGLRHHYWHLGPNVSRTLRFHEQAGFTYDSSLAFNDHVGFRRSVALPFHPFDAGLGRPLHTIQLPTFCMDGNLFYTSADVDGAVACVAGLIDVIAASEGFGAIDWHIETSFPGNAEYHGWGVAYQEILALLAARRDIWTTDLGKVAAWSDERTAAVAGSAGN
jgi:hypothetical protein